MIMNDNESQGRHLTLSGKITLFLAATVIVIAGIQSWLFISNAAAHDEQMQQQGLNRLYESHQQDVDMLTGTAEALSQSLADRSDVQELLAAQDGERLQMLLEPLFASANEQHGVAELSFLDKSGSIVARLHTAEASADDSSARTAVAVASSRKISVSGIDVSGEQPTILSVSPVFDGGEFAGLVEVGLDYGQSFLDELKAAKNADYRLWISTDASSGGAGSPSSGSAQSPTARLFYFAGTNPDSSTLSAETYESILNGGPPSASFLSDGGQKWAVLAAPLFDHGEQIRGVLEIRTLRTNSLAKLRRERISIAVITAGLTLMAIWGSWVFLRRMLQQPLTQLTEAASTIAAGEIPRQIEASSEDELGLLANVFNEMNHNLRQRIDAEKSARDEVAKLAQAERLEKEKREEIVANYLEFVERVAEGDLTVRLDLDANTDSMTILGYNLNNMVQSLSEMTSQVRDAVVNITSSAAQIMAVTSQQASGATEQSAAITQTSTTIDEVSAIVDQAFTKAESVAIEAQHADQVSQQGRQAILDTSRSMDQIKSRVTDIADNILALSERTQQIGEIIATVNDIASQSNLLALNASVEAARAGEHGKGFNVVAVEVRNLAEQSKQATAQVRNILNEIQRATNAAVMATEQGTKGVDDGLRQTNQTGATIQQLASTVSANAAAAQQIVASAQQQSTGMEQIGLAMRNINQATVQNLAATRQAEKVAQDLSGLARQMEALVSQYKL